MLTITGQSNQENVVAATGANLLGHLIAVQIRQADVDQGDLRRGCQGLLDAARPGFRHIHLVAPEGQERAQRFAAIGIVFDNEHVTGNSLEFLATIGGRDRLRGGRAFFRRQGRQADYKFAALSRPFAESRHGSAMHVH